MRQQHVAVGDVRVRAERDRGHLEPALDRPLVQRLDVGDDLLELEPARVDAPASSAQNMNASSGSALCPTRIRTRGHASSGEPRSRWLARSMTKPPLSEAIQDYLKGIYKLQAARGRVTITAVARDQGVSAASASAMVKKLAALELLEHEPYRGARLTDAGERVALEVIRHHRLLELYLAETLGLDVDAVHDEADRLEHVISEELEARIDRALGFPTHDPHGDPIPDANLELAAPTALRQPVRLAAEESARAARAAPRGGTA